MEIEFDCDCGSTASALTRSNDGEVSFHIQCDDCESIYAVTVTPISGPHA